MSTPLQNKTYELLKKYASREQYVTYGEMYDQIGVDFRDASERKRGTELLVEVNKISYEENEVLISAIVIKNDTQIPAETLFNQINFPSAC